MAFISLVKKAEAYVTTFITNNLPANMHFHNLQHTQYVVNAATEIGLRSNLTKQEMVTVKLAAWFHDTGYCFAYSGHEDGSIAIAATFLSQQKCNDEQINIVTNCIAATRIPQNPKTLLQRVICDADMHHLSDKEYLIYATRLRKEWEFKLNKKYTAAEWQEDSLNLLIKHQYFTDYGKSVLQQGKLNNIDKLLTL